MYEITFIKQEEGKYALKLSNNNYIENKRTASSGKNYIDESAEITDACIWSISEDNNKFGVADWSISNTLNNILSYLGAYSGNKTVISAYNSSAVRPILYKKQPSLTIGKEKYATFYSDQAYVMPEGVTGGIITAANNETGTLTVDYRYTAGSTVPAKTALLVKGEAKTYTFDYSASTEAAPTGNLLHGADAVDAEGKTYVEGTNVKYYILSHNTDGQNFGFYWAAGDGAAIAYQAPFAFLAIDFGSTQQSAPKLFSLGGGEGTTGIKGIENAGEAADGKIYTVTGAYVGKDRNNLSKGIYIVNGKKIAVK